MSNESKKFSQGSTLIEMLIYIAVVAMVLSSLVLFSISIVSSRSKTYVVQEVQANTRVALAILSQKIRASNGVDTSTSQFGSDPGKLTLFMSDPSKNPTVFDLDQDDGVLRITEGASLPVTLVSDEVKVTHLMFTNLTGSSTHENIRIEMTVGFNNTGTNVEYDYTQSVQTSVSSRQ